MLQKSVWIKFISLFLVVAFVSACFPFGTLSAAAENLPGQYGALAKTVKSIAVLSAPTNTKYIFEYDGYESYYWDDTLEEYVPYFCYDYNSRDGFSMKVSYTDGTSGTYSYDDTYSNDFEGNTVEITTNENGVIWGIGKHTALVSYMGKTTSFEVEVVQNPVRSIEVISKPEKTQYMFEYDGWWGSYYDSDSGEYLPLFYYSTYDDRDGFQMKVNYTNGTSAIYSYDDNWSYEFEGRQVSIETNQDETWNVGKHNAVVTYLGRTTSFEVEVIQNPVASIEVVTPPDRTTYTQNSEGYWREQWIDDQSTSYYYYDVDYYFNGMQIKINYADGSSKLYRYNDFYTPYGNEDYFTITTDQDNEHWGAGQHTATVSYLGKTDTFDVSVVEGTVKSIEVVSLPTDHDYIVGEVANIDGMKLKVNYKDNTSKTITIDSKNNVSKDRASELLVDGHTMRFMFEDQDGEYVNAKSGTNMLFIDYMGASASLNVTAAANRMDHFVIKKQPNRFNGTGMVITVYETTGTSYDLTVSEVDSYAGGGDEGFFGQASFARTEKGNFELNTEIYYDTNFHVTGYTITFNGMELSGTDLPLAGAGELALRTVSVGSLITKDKAGFSFNGTITASNIDAVIFSLYPISNYARTKLSADELTTMIKTVYGCQSVDLTLSKNYDPQTKIYTVPGQPGGECPYDNTAVTVDNNGNYAVNYSWNWENPTNLKTSTVVVSKDWKIISISSSSGTVTAGDINNDGVVDLMDVTTLSRYVAGWPGLTVVPDALDVNHDGGVDLMDVTLLSRFVAGWNVTI